jgi:hypothetical protein
MRQGACANLERLAGQAWGPLSPWPLSPWPFRPCSNRKIRIAHGAQLQRVISLCRGAVLPDRRRG